MVSDPNLCCLVTLANATEEDESVSSGRRAAQYIRMSTEHQQYSTENQSAAIERYAKANDMCIVRSFTDAGRSGVTLAGRNALKDLIYQVEHNQADFEFILVYDVSRWGRFQDADESAYYEYVCKRAGISVRYCAELFENDNSVPSNLLKALKRTMAGEYSRELSAKVFAGMCRLIEKGFSQGAKALYGFRRQLVDKDGNPKQILGPGEHKSIQTDRVILIPGPEHELQVVRKIFDLFTKHGKTEPQIASLLNSRGLLREIGRPWSRYSVLWVLQNPKYIGTNIYNRSSMKLAKKIVRNPPEMWIRCPNAFTPIVSVEQFERAQAIFQARRERRSDEGMLEPLRQLLRSAGKLTARLIDETQGVPSTDRLLWRFGSLERVYSLIGYNPGHDYTYLAVRRKIQTAWKQHSARIIEQLRTAGATVQADEASGLMTINGEFTALFWLVKCRMMKNGRLHWIFRLNPRVPTDLVIAGRLAPGNITLLDYYIFPNIDGVPRDITLAPENEIDIDVYRCATLQAFVQSARRTALGKTT